MNKFKVAAVQMEPRLRDVDRNLSRAAKLVKQAVKAGASIVCLPEVFDTGYDLEWIRHNAGIHTRQSKDFLKKLSTECNALIVAGIASLRDGHLYNSSYIFAPTGHVVGRYDKNFLFRALPQEEHKYFSESDEREVIDTPFGKLGFAICNDIRYPSLFEQQAVAGVKVFFVSAAWSQKRLEHWITLLRARAIENQVYVVAANQYGKTGLLRLCGHSMIVDYDGNIMEMRKKGEGVIVAEIDYLALKERRKALPTFYVMRDKSVYAEK